MTNKLYYGDNLQVLRESIPDASVDLVYLDPPFNSAANYNVLFKAPTGEQSQAQIEAFEDTWHWNDTAALAFEEVITGHNTDTAHMLRAMRSFLGENDMMAYLAMMAARLLQLHRVLKPTGSLYLHCDPTASHYLKIMLDAVFGPENFLNEVIWKRTSAHSSAKRYGPVHDTVLFYSKGREYLWNKTYQKYDADYLDLFFDQEDEDGRRWKRSDLTGAGTRNGETGKPWRGIDITKKGRHWAYPPAHLDKLDKEGRVHWPKKEDGMPRLKQYPEDLPGVPLQDVITDVRPMHNLSAERLGYPTQKPVALMERILAASTREGDVVLDPFCGCGTTIHAAEKLHRQWIGIDVTHLAISLIERRMKDAFPGLTYEVVGTPKDLAGARDLALRDKYQFQWWITSLIGAVPAGGKKKGMDRGIDGYLNFRDADGEPQHAIVSVKGGEHVTAPMIRDLKGTIDREGAAMGIFLCLSEPTREMVREAAASGFYETGGKKFPKVQMLTAEELFAEKRPQVPFGFTEGFKVAKKEKQTKQGSLF